jgi:hypothetical protein
MWKSLAATVAFALVEPTLGVAQDALVSQKSVPEQIVDAFNGVFGVHPGARATFGDQVEERQDHPRLFYYGTGRNA